VEEKASARVLVAARNPKRLDAEQLCRLYAEPVYRFATMVSNHPADAEDLAHDALERAIRALDRYDSERGAVEPWLWRIVVNAARDRGRVERRRRRLLERVGALLPRQAIDPDRIIDAAIDDEQLLAAVRRLPRRDRALIALRFGADLKYAQVGASLGMTAEAAGLATRRALSTLKHVVEIETRSVG
jgi:RNA polymerase sigma-70 factor (ECF subfamily)